MIGTFYQATTRSLVTAIPLGTYQFRIADLKGQILLMVPTGVSEKRPVTPGDPGYRPRNLNQGY